MLFLYKSLGQRYAIRVTNADSVAVDCLDRTTVATI